jgi:hypothetical protein
MVAQTRGAASAIRPAPLGGAQTKAPSFAGDTHSSLAFPTHWARVRASGPCCTAAVRFSPSTSADFNVTLEHDVCRLKI